MEVRELPVASIGVPSWNPNSMDAATRARLRSSVHRFGLVVPLVVRAVGNDRHETIGGAQRLEALRDLAAATVPCVVVDADDAEARLLAQALNHIQGVDDPSLRAEALRDILASVPAQEVLDILPETAASLAGLATLGQVDLAEHLQAWQRARAARLRHLQIELTAEQLSVVELALQRVLAAAPQGTGDGANPNRRGNALFLLCRSYLDQLEGTP